MPRFHCNCLECWLHMCLFVFSLSHGSWFEFLVAKCNLTDDFKCLLKALAVATLGGDQMGQRVDNLTTEDLKRFYLQVRTMSLSILPWFVICWILDEDCLQICEWSLLVKACTCYWIFRIERGQSTYLSACGIAFPVFISSLFSWRSGKGWCTQSARNWTWDSCRAGLRTNPSRWIIVPLHHSNWKHHHWKQWFIKVTLFTYKGMVECELRVFSDVMHYRMYRSD